VATIIATNKLLTLLFLGIVYAGIALQQTVALSVTMDIGRKYVGGLVGMFNTMCTFGGFVLSVSFGYFVTWFGSYDLALIPIVGALAIGALAWLRIDATEELLPEDSHEVAVGAALPVPS
jgi:hypothetical protein